MIFIETKIFTKEIKRFLPDDEYHKLQVELVFRPDAGKWNGYNEKTGF
jgi:hypothetical protein